MPSRPLFLLYFLTILLLTTLPLNGIGVVLNTTFVVQIRLDYLLHSLLFIPWLFLLRHACGVRLFVALLLGILFAACTEGLQYFLPYRSFNINDQLANVLGIFLGFALLIPRLSIALQRMLRLS